MIKPEHEKLFDDITLFIRQSRELLAKGAYAELAGLDDHIRSMCEQVLALSPEEQNLYADRLKSLFDELSILGDMLAVQRDAIAAEVKGLSGHQKANVAYMTTEVIDKKKEEPK